MAEWVFNGDVNLEYGGTFIDLSNWDYGYADAVVVTDLDSGYGFRGAVMIEHVVINIGTGKERTKRCKDALRFAGIRLERRQQTPEQFKGGLRHMIADALCSYGYRDPDPDDGWDGYLSHHTEIVQMEPDGPMKYDGWKVDKRLFNTTLEEYVQSVHLK